MKTVIEIKSEYNIEDDFPHFLDKLAGEFDPNGYFEHLASLVLVDGDKHLLIHAYFKDTFVTNDEAFIVFPSLKRSIHTDDFDKFADRMVELGFKIFLANSDYEYSEQFRTIEERKLHCLRWVEIE